MAFSAFGSDPQKEIYLMLHIHGQKYSPLHTVFVLFKLRKNECWSPSSKLILAPTNGWASILKNTVLVPRSFLGGSDSEGSACNAGDPGSVVGSGRSPGEGNGNPLHYSCLESSMDGEPGGIQPVGSQRVRHD